MSIRTHADPCVPTPSHTQSKLITRTQSGTLYSSTAHVTPRNGHASHTGAPLPPMQVYIKPMSLPYNPTPITVPSVMFALFQTCDRGGGFARTPLRRVIP